MKSGRSSKRQFGKSRKKLAYTILGLLLILSLSAFIAIKYASGSILVHTKVNTTLKIGDYVGIKLDTDKLHFGTTSTSGFSEREFILLQNYSGHIYLSATGPMAGWLFLPEQDSLQIRANQNRSIILYAVPRGENAVPGEYESTIDIWVLRRKPGLLTKALLGGQEIQQLDPASIKAPKVSLTIVPPHDANPTN